MVDVRTLPIPESSEEIVLTLDELAREGARWMIAAGLRAEADDYVARFADELDEDGHRLVVRNGRARERKVTVGSGTVPVRAPRVNDKRTCEETGERVRFSSKILPAYARRSPKVTEVLPILYLRGLSTGDFRPALEDLLGEDAAGLSPSTISRLCKEWESHYDRFRKRHLGFSRYAYLFVDGVHVSVRPGGRQAVPAGRDRRARGRHQGVAGRGGRLPRVDRELGGGVPGYEASRAWLPEARGRRRRARGVGGTQGRVPRGRRARCWVHQTANVLDCLPKRLQSKAKELLHEIVEAPTRKDAKLALETFREEFATKYPKALERLDKDWKPLTAFYDFPAEHWRHLRTTNPIESSFATVKLRTRVTKRAGSKAAALAMAYKLLITAQERWRRFNGHELIAEVLDDAKFKDGVRVTDDEATTQDEEVAA